MNRGRAGGQYVTFNDRFGFGDFASGLATLGRRDHAERARDMS